MLVIELGQRHVAAGRFRRRLGGGRVSRRCVVIEHGRAAPGESDWLKATGEALAGVARAIGTPGTTTLVIPDRHALVKHLRIPVVPPAERPAAIAFEVSQRMPVPLEALAWEARIVDAGPAGTLLRVTAARQDWLARVVSECAAHGFRPAAIMPRASALAGHLAGVVGPAWLVEDDGTSTTVVAVEGPRMQAMVIAEGRAPTLHDDLRRFLADTQADLALRRPDQVLLLAPEEPAPPIAAVLAAELHVTPRRLGRFDGIDVTGDATRTEAKRAAAHLGAVTGAARLSRRREIGEGELLPREWAKSRRAWRRARRRSVVAVLLVLASLPFCMRAWHLRRAMALRAADAERRYVAVQAVARRVDAERVRLTELERKCAALRATQASRTAWIGLLAGLQEALERTEDAWLDDLTIAKPSPPLSGKARRDTQPPSALSLELTGRLLERTADHHANRDAAGDRVRRLIVALGELPGVASVGGERFDSGRPGLLRFEVTLVMAPDWLRPSL